MNVTEWKTLPMELMSHFDDCKEWAIMERVWFKSNHSNKFNLKYLNQTTPIKTRGKLMKSLDGLVIKRWIKKTPIGRSGKHHKYALNRESFVQWIESALVEKSGNPTVLDEPKVVGKPDQKRSGNPTINGQETRPNLVRKSDCIDNRDNSLEKIPVKTAVGTESFDSFIQKVKDSKSYEGSYSERLKAKTKEFDLKYQELLKLGYSSSGFREGVKKLNLEFQEFPELQVKFWKN